MQSTIQEPLSGAPSGQSTEMEKLAGKYLTFTLKGQSYGIDVLRVREIIRVTQITSVPQMPDYVRGVLNLRGRIIPVLDLRLRFGLAEAQDTDTTCIVVAQVRGSEGKNIQMGLVVDGVEEVLNITARDIEPTPDFGHEAATEYLRGIAKTKAGVKALLDIDELLALDANESRLPSVAPAAH